MSAEDNGGLGELFTPTPPEEKRQRRTEYWYWNDKATLREMKVVRDGLGRFVEFKDYTPLVVGGKETEQGERKRKRTLGNVIFG